MKTKTRTYRKRQVKPAHNGNGSTMAEVQSQAPPMTATEVPPQANSVTITDVVTGQSRTIAREEFPEYFRKLLQSVADNSPKQPYAEAQQTQQTQQTQPALQSQITPQEMEQARDLADALENWLGQRQLALIDGLCLVSHANAVLVRRARAKARELFEM